MEPSDDDIFITQTNFNLEDMLDTNAEEKCFPDLGFPLLDEILKDSPKQYPDFSDISQEELVNTCEAAERFAKPVSDGLVESKTNKR